MRLKILSSVAPLLSCIILVAASLPLHAVEADSRFADIHNKIAPHVDRFSSGDEILRISEESKKLADGGALSATTFVRSLSYMAKTRDPREVHDEFLAAAQNAENDEAALSRALPTLLALAYGAGMCDEHDGGAVMDCAVAVVPDGRGPASLQVATTSGSGTRQVPTISLASFVYSGINSLLVGQSSSRASASSSNDIADFKWRLDRYYTESKCGGSPGFYNEWSACGSDSDSDEVKLEHEETGAELTARYGYGYAFVVQAVCDNSCRMWGEIAGGANVKYAGLSDIASIQAAVGIYVSTWNSLDIAMQGLAFAVREWIEEETDGKWNAGNPPDYVGFILAHGERRDWETHPDAHFRVRYPAECPIAPSKYDSHPTFYAPDILREEFGGRQEFGLFSFDWQTHNQAGQSHDARNSRHAFPGPSDFFRPVQGDLGVSSISQPVRVVDLPSVGPTGGGCGGNPYEPTCEPPGVEVDLVPDVATGVDPWVAYARFYSAIKDGEPEKVTSLAGSGNSDLLTQWRFTSIRPWKPNITLTVSAFSEPDSASCARNRYFSVANGYGLSAYGSQFLHYHGAATPGHSWTRHTRHGGLPQVDVLIGFDAGNKSEDTTSEIGRASCRERV